MKVVEGGDGGGEVPLGGVQLLDVPRDLLHHRLALPRLVLDVSAQVNLIVLITNIMKSGEYILTQV